jgi:5-formyltetrahydrofolate cyclo-ligase
MTTEKQALREKLLLWRANCRKGWLKEQSRELCETLLAWPPWATAANIMGYLAYKNEASVDGALNSALAEKKKCSSLI